MTSPNVPFTAGDILSASEMNDLPFGLTQRIGGTAGTAFVAGTPLTVLTTTATIRAGRFYSVTAGLAVQCSTNAGPNALYVEVPSGATKSLYYSNLAIGTNLHLGVRGTVYFGATELGVSTGSAVKTFNLIWKSGAAGGLSADPDSYVGAGSFEQQMFIVDLGTI